MLFNLCVGTAVGIEISSQWWPEKTTLIQKKTYFGFFLICLYFTIVVSGPTGLEK